MVGGTGGCRDGGREREREVFEEGLRRLRADFRARLETGLRLQGRRTAAQQANEADGCREGGGASESTSEPLPCEYGTYETVKARFWLWLWPDSGLGFQVKVLETTRRFWRGVVLQWQRQ